VDIGGEAFTVFPVAVTIAVVAMPHRRLLHPQLRGAADASPFRGPGRSAAAPDLGLTLPLAVRLKLVEWAIGLAWDLPYLIVYPTKLFTLLIVYPKPL
jgi:hypothetical protein